ncbi:hypothetical protein [Bacillus thuringiensis]|uniref:Uncharacterized protein n=1 Tax=Bacillus thuringiensis subsp. jegathesan TaxID=56955 RepID=A0A9X6QXR1_BACTJ|nr:hypothetical protein [Bacillus thuringiensis]OUB63548.1 hypothetical protein BK750_20190 [Bacillus thuringiensis serovar jegathesan]
MKQIIREVKENLVKKKFFSILILVQVTMLFVLMSVLFLQFYNVNTKTKSLYGQYKDKNVYQLSDNLFDEEEKSFLKSGDSLGYLKSFYKQLNENTEFTYLVTASQGIGIENFRGNDTFLEGYHSEGGAFPPYEFHGEQYRMAKALQVNEQVFTTFDLKLEQGRKFKGEDYLYEDKKILPIILGADYKSTYKIGDRLKIEYIFTQMNAEIIGFLEPNTVFPVREDFEFYADKHILMPAFTMEKGPLTQENDIFQKRQYLQLVNGQIFTEKDTFQIRKLIDGIAETTQFNYVTIIGANGIGIDLMISMLNQNINLLIMLVVVMLCFCIASIALAFIMKWNIQIKKYAIHIISGANTFDIVMYMFAEVFLLILISLGIAFVIITNIVNMPVLYYVMIAIIGIIIACVGLLPMYFKVKNLNISKMLKKKV